MNDSNSYIFKSKIKLNQKLNRETITTDVNRVTGFVVSLIELKLNIISQRFRIQFITNLLEDLYYIEFINQAIQFTQKSS